MTMAPFRFEPLAEHDRASFDCGVDALNEYFRTQVGQDVRRRVSSCYVTVENGTGCVAGYYTLSATSIKLTDLPSSISKRLPRYPTVPAVLIGRLAVDGRHQGCKLGGVLVFDAIDRTCRSGIAAFAVIVNAKGESAIAFYERYGFQRFRDLERKLFLPISDALRRLTSGSQIRADLET